jgi:glycosyltransferase involved in cell wall biosynthesis
MRILLISSGSGSRGGGEIFLDYLAEGLAGRGHEVLAWIPAHPRMDEVAEKCSRSAQVIRADYRNTYDHRGRSLSTCFNWGVSRRLAAEWGALRPDAIHLNKQNLEDGLDLLRAVNACSAPAVCTIHLTQTARYLGAKSAWLRDIIAREALVAFRGVLTAVQEAREAELRSFLGGRVRSQTVYNGVPFKDKAALAALREAKRKELGLTPSDFLVLGAGRLVAQKRPFVFLETAKELRRHFPAAKFLWAGDGNLAEEWNAWVAREGLQSAISCAGWQDDVTPYFAAADLLLHVAEYEGLPLAIAEAMAADLPCAVTRNFASEIPVFDERTVLFVDDAQELSRRLRDSAQLRAVAASAQSLAQTRFSIDAMAAAYERLYAGAAEARRAA